MLNVGELARRTNEVVNKLVKDEELGSGAFLEAEATRILQKKNMDSAYGARLSGLQHDCRVLH
ncbi:hypothetical protein BKA66DRAFT_469452 [Pyrenochaeta sp. MPI-SDFR-AT-0127]|nr:hypothetical protein BKA66DRAFT_469452 [Pyrenochaeta sp. MPI-SDFR-AT-0127]